MTEGSKILLHACCGPCASASVERLRKEGYEPLLYYANSNIWPENEWDKRRLYIERLADILGAELIIEPYAHDEWKQSVRGFEAEPEGGPRCKACFAYNLELAAVKARDAGIHRFTTTLTISPHKNSGIIFSVGNRSARFLPVDFKKRSGFKRSIELSKRFDLYRQDYCGCEYSIRTP
jgi:epoxyqueuosine reductase